MHTGKILVADGLHDTGPSLRSRLHAAVDPDVLPAYRAELLAHAGAGHVTDKVREIIESLPPDTEFRTLEEILAAYQKRPHHL